MSIFSAIIEAVTANIQDPSDYEYENDDDGSEDDASKGDLSTQPIDKPWWTDWL